MLLVAAGMAFKIAAVPFHMWAPDVYEGAPTPVTAFLSVGSKAASFAMLLRIFLEGVPSMAPQWTQVFYMLAVLTMTVGNIAALTQSNIKRMLAYSSIAHAGYVLIGLVAATPRGVTATLRLPADLRVHADGRLRASSCCCAAQDVIGDELKDLSGLYFRSPSAACRHARVHAVARRHPADGRLHGQALDLQRRHRGGLRVAGGDRRAQQRRLPLLLRPRRRVHVDEGGDGRHRRIAPGPALTVALGVALAATLFIGVYPAAVFEFAEASARTLGAAAPALTAR